MRPRNRYHSYRGRRTKGKVALAAFLILVILAAVGVILLQRHIIYDETGTPRLEILWQEELPGKETAPPADLDLVVQEPKETEAEIRGFRLPVGPFTRESYDAAMAAADPAYNAVVVVLKDEGGTVYFDAETAVSGSAKTTAETAEILAALTGSETHRAIAQISCFHDPKAANADVEGMGLKNTGGYIFYDGNNSQWLDPAKPAARRYVCSLAVEAAEQGFDEILLTDVGYPTEGKLDKIAYGETEKSENLRIFMEELQSALEPYDVSLTVELSARAISTGQDEVFGQKLSEIALAADCVCAVTSMEEAAALAEAVKAETGGKTLFVPLLAEKDSTVSGSWLLR